MNDIGRYLADTKLSAKTFESAHPHPVFVYRTGKAETTDPNLAQFKTRHVTREVDRNLPLNVAESAIVKPHTVFEIAKAPGAAYPNRISIGRTKSSDVQVTLPRISKFHAWISWNPERTEFMLTDAGSTNGTRVDGRNLAANEAATLADGMIVSFGPYDFAFFMPAGFYAFLQALAALR